MESVRGRRRPLSWKRPMSSRVNQRASSSSWLSQVIPVVSASARNPSIRDEGKGHPEDRNVALEELEFFSHEVNILGVYPAHPFRRHGEAGENA